VGLVDEEVVDAGLLEPDAVVLGVLGEEPLVGLLHLGDAPLELLDRQALAVLRAGERGAGGLDLLAEVLGHQVAAERQPGEPGLGEHDPVPVAGRGAGDELLASGLREPFPVGDEDAGGRVELEPLAGELLEHVVRDHHRGLRREPSRRSSIAAMTIVAVLPAPTAWASRARPSVRMRATAARWWWRGVKVPARPGRVRWLAVVVREHGRGEQLVVAASEPARRVRGPPTPRSRTGW
jgi:hypothetical protein